MGIDPANLTPRTHLDLFSGIGGFALACRWAGGIKTIGFSEVDPYCCRVLEKHWPGVPNYGDIKRWKDWPAIGPIDLLTGGPPCQPISCAGEQRGAEDDRWLWTETLAVVGKYRPRVCLFENPDEVDSFDGGLAFEAVLTALENLGYKVAPPIVVPACAIGADHRRDRIWITAHADGVRKPQPKGSKQTFRRRDLPCAGKVAADSDCIGQPKPGMDNTGKIAVGARHRKTVPNTDGAGLQAPRQHRASTSEAQGDDVQPAIASFPGRETYPDLLRTIHGLPRRMDRASRIKALGNAIVPQVALQIIKAIPWDLTPPS